MSNKRLPPGRHVYDSLNGLRVGAFAGLFAGAGIAALTGIAWFLAVGILAGGTVGYLWERRRIREDERQLPPVDDEAA